MTNSEDFKWDDSLLLHYDIIDDQHKAIFKAFDDLIENCNRDRNRAQRGEHVAKCIEFLIQYVDTHFTHEECLMKKHNYPHLGSHKKQHREFRETVHNLQNDLKDYKDRSSFHAELITEMMAWLKLHIKVIDRRFVDYVNSKET